MPTYKTSEKCFIGNTIREEGSTFTIDKPLKPLPSYLTKVKLTKAQHDEVIADAKAAQEAADDAAHDVDLVTEKAPDFLGADKEDNRTPQQKSADTRKANAAAKLATAEGADVESTDDTEAVAAGESDSGELETL